MSDVDDSDAGANALELPVRILFALVEDPRRQNEPCSLARLAGRLDVRQSTLRRTLALLEDAGLVEVQLGEDGGGAVSLTTVGRATWLQLADDPDNDDGGGTSPPD
jgi:DNA-binding MarR family transcriptional regulator